MEQNFILELSNYYEIELNSFILIYSPSFSEKSIIVGGKIVRELEQFNAKQSRSYSKSNIKGGF